MTIKRFLASILCLFVMLSSIQIIASEEDGQSEILFQNDFEQEINAAYVNPARAGTSVDLYNYGGGYGQVLRFSATKENVQNINRRVIFNFNRAMTTGDTYVISYDYMNGQVGKYPFVTMTAKSSTGDITKDKDQYITAANPNNASTAGWYGYYKTKNGSDPTSWAPEKMVELKENTWMHMDVVVKMNPSGREYNFFVDGEKKGSWINEYVNQTTGVIFYNDILKDTESVYYVDNLVVKQLFEPRAEVSVSGKKGGDTVTVALSDTFTDRELSKISADKVVVKDEKDNAVRISGVSVSDGKLVVKTAEPLEYDANYKLTFENITDYYGRELDSVVFSALSEIDESGKIVLRIKNVSAIRYDETKIPIEGMMPADIREIVFALNTEISEFEDGITLNGEPLKLKYDNSQKTLTASEYGLLEGKTDYTIEVNDKIKNADGISIKPYANSFKTEEGKFEIRDFKWCDESGNAVSPSEISGRKTYYLTADAINTTSSPQSIVLTYSAISGERQSGFAYKEISVQNGGYAKENIAYQLKESDERVSAFITDSFSNLKLMTEPIYLINNNVTESASDIRCTVSQNGYEKVKNAAVQVYEQGKDSAAVSSDPPIYQNVVVPNNGKIEFSFAVSSGKSGLYNVYISNPSGGSAKYAVYNYVNPTANAEVLEWLGSLSNIPAEEEFENKADDLGFHNDLYDANKAEFLKLVYSDSAAKVFKSASTETAIAELNKIAIQAALNNGKKADVFKYSSDINLNGSRLGKFMNKNFITQTLMTNVNERIAENVSAFNKENLTNVERFDNNLIQAFVLATVNYPDGYGNIRDVVSEFKDEIGILSSDVTSDALQAIEGKNYKTYSELEEAMKSANENKGTSSGSPGSGGGSRGGSKGVSNVNIDTSIYGNNDAVVPPSDKYDDIESVPWAREAILSLSDKGIINGNGNGEFLPNDSVKREEFTKMAVLAFANTDSAQTNRFEDVADGEWYAKYVNAAAALGIVNGQSKSLFGIGQTITRQDMAVIVYKAAISGETEFDKTDDYTKFADDSDISDYAKEAVYTLMSAGIINGVGENRFAPLDSAARAEAAKMIYAVLMYAK